jgi:hypothetical protein
MPWALTQLQKLQCVPTKEAHNFCVEFNSQSNCQHIHILASSLLCHPHLGWFLFIYLFIYWLKGQVPSGLIFPSNLKVLLWARFSLDLLVTMPNKRLMIVHICPYLELESSHMWGLYCPAAGLDMVVQVVSQGTSKPAHHQLLKCSGSTRIMNSISCQYSYI